MKTKQGSLFPKVDKKITVSGVNSLFPCLNFKKGKIIYNFCKANVNLERSI